MKLTQRETDFLKKQEYRSDAVKSLKVIERAFSKIGIKPTQKLIDFQLNYGGLTIYAGFEPICFGILHGEKVKIDLNLTDYPEFPQDIIKWAKNSELIVRISDFKVNLYSKTEITNEQKYYLKKITNKK